MILVAPNDRRVRIEVGYGLEGSFSDMFCKEIIDKTMTPQFRQENYGRGLEGAVDMIVAKMRAAPTLPANDNAPAGPPLTAILTGLALIVAGAQLWIESRALHLVVASSVMAMVAGLAGFFPVLGNLGELVLMAGILAAIGVHPSTARVRRAVVSQRAQQVGWVAWPVFFFGSLLTFIPMFGTMDPADKLPVSALQYDVASASQGAWLVLMVLHAHFAISVFGLAKSGSRLRKFHVWFGYANLLLCFGGQLLFIFPQTAALGSQATTLVFVTITVHVILGTIFTVRRRGSRRKRSISPTRSPVYAMSTLRLASLMRRRAMSSMRTTK